MSITPTQSQEDLATAVRQWVHFDNLAENLNKQIANVRTLRGQYETKVLDLLAHQNLRNASLRVNGATLQCATKSKATDLSWTFLEEQLHEYYRNKGTRDDTPDILTFLHRHRGGKTIEYLKKTPLQASSVPSTPAPQGQQGQQGQQKR
jgi:hypothetical protein